MVTRVKVNVTWLGKRAGLIPAGTRYSTVAKFAEDENSWTKEAWSILIEFDRSPAEQGNPSEGIARFLVDDAPHQRLVPGVTFELYEGQSKVAKVEIC